MKQAVLVISHQNIPHLIDLVNSLSEEFYFFIHLDKKGKFHIDDINALKSLRNVVLVSRRYSINWGGLNLTLAIISLAQEAVKIGEVEYIHVLSGVDFPIKRSEEITKFLKANAGREFIENFQLKTCSWENHGLDRLQFYHFTDVFNSKTVFGKHAIKILLALQRILKVKRSVSDLPELYGGATWWTLSSSCLNYVISYLNENPRFLTRFKHTLIADEIILQTIVMNSRYRENVVNDNLRMILWESHHATHPVVLDENNYDLLIQSKQLFARKFGFPQSENLIRLLKSSFAS